LRARASDAVDELRELRARVVDLRLRLARERLRAGEEVAALGEALTAERMLPLARAAGARLTGVRRERGGLARGSAAGGLAGAAERTRADAGPAPLLGWVAQAVPAEVPVERFRAAEDRFELVLRASSAVGARVLDHLASRPGVDLVSPARQSGRWVARGRWRPDAEGVLAAVAPAV